MSVFRVLALIVEAEILGKVRRVEFTEGEGLVIQGLSLTEANVALGKLATGSVATETPESLVSRIERSLQPAAPGVPAMKLEEEQRAPAPAAATVQPTSPPALSVVPPAGEAAAPAAKPSRKRTEPPPQAAAPAPSAPAPAPEAAKPPEAVKVAEAPPAPAPVSTPAPAPAAAPSPAPAASAPVAAAPAPAPTPAAPAPVGQPAPAAAPAATSSAGAFDPAGPIPPELTSATKLRDVIVFLKDKGMKDKDQMIAYLEAIKPQVNCLKVISGSLAERVGRALDVLADS